MIKLEVNHQKHQKKSGAKLSLNKKKSEQKINTSKEKQIEKPDKEQEKPDKSLDKKNKKDKQKKKQKQKDKKQKKNKKEAIKQENNNEEQKQDKKDKKKDKKDKGKKDKKQDKKKDKQDKKIKKSKDRLESSIVSNSNIEQETIKNIKKQQNHVKLTIQELIQQYKEPAQRLLFNNHGHDDQKERQVKMHLEKLQKEKEQRHKKLEYLDERKKQIEESKSKRKQAALQLKKQRQKERKINRIEEKIKQLAENGEKRKQQYSKFKQYWIEKKRQNPRYKKYEQNYNQLADEIRQEQEEYLQEIKKKHSPINKKQLDQFDERYAAQKLESDVYRKHKLRLQRQMIKEENKQRMEGLWKGRSHKIIHQEAKNMKQLQKQERSRLEDQKNFSKMVKNSLLMSKQSEGQQKQQESIPGSVKPKDTQRYHQKYVQGVNYGLVPLHIKQSLSVEEKLKLGNSYLQSLRKSDHRSKSSMYNQKNKLLEIELPKPRAQTYKLRHKSNPYYQPEKISKTIDVTDNEAIGYNILKINSKTKDKKLQQGIIKYGNYGSILDIQDRQNKVNKLMVKQINEKIDFIKKL